MMHWHVLRSKHRYEDFLYHQLQCRDIEAYYPCIHKRKQSQPRKMKPYFPGYLFVHVDLSLIAFSELQWIPGAAGLVCFGGVAAWVPENIVQSIRSQVEQLNALYQNERNHLQVGDEIMVHSGPFAGYSGIFSSYLSDRERVTVFLNFVRDQQLRVELPAGQINSVKRAQA